MSRESYAEELKAQIAPLLSTGLLRVVEDRSDPTHFADTLIVLEGDDIKVRLIADRWHLLADVCSPEREPEWLPLRSVLPLAGVEEWDDGGEPDLGAGSWKTADQIGRHLRNNLAAIASFVNSNDPRLKDLAAALS